MNRTIRWGMLSAGAVAALGCARSAERGVRGAVATAETRPVATEAGVTCVTLQRGSARRVADTRIAERWPDRSYGSEPSAFAGRVGGAARHTLVFFDVSELPADALVVRATLTLHRMVGTVGEMKAFNVTTAWNEELTWNGFGGAFDGSVAADRVEVSVSAPGPVSFDLTAFVQRWVSGAVENHGVLLAQDSANVGFATSEAAEPRQRPRLDVCYARP